MSSFFVFSSQTGKEIEHFGAAQTLFGGGGHFLRPNMPDPESSGERDTTPLCNDTHARAPHGHSAALKRTVAHSPSPPQGPRLQVSASHMTQTPCPKQTNNSIDFSNTKHTITLHSNPRVSFAQTVEGDKEPGRGAGRGEGEGEKGEVVSWRIMWISLSSGDPSSSRINALKFFCFSPKWF